MRMPLATPRIGRDREVAAVVDAIARGERLITITGAGGIGKSRLVDALGAHVGEAEVVRADLSDARGPEALSDAVAAGAGIGAAGRSSGTGWLGRALASRGPIVLVLDPLDRLLDAVPCLAEWLAAAPELAIVVVSRARLRAPGECVIELEPLPIEPEAVDLFVAAVRAQRHDYAPGEPELRMIAEIARELDGVPLAIELAASRMAVLGAGALLHRLRSRFEILRRPGAGVGAGGDRHGALEASIAWSWEVLEPVEREVLAQCTVFRGGFGLEAAEAVVELSHPGSVIDVIESLRAKSLIRAHPGEPAGEVRLSLYESVRAYAVRGLPASSRELEARHARCYVESAESWAASIDTPEGHGARTRLRIERENLLAVVERILGRGPVSARAAELALRALVALAPVLALRGPLEVLAGHLERALEVTAGSGADPRLQARGLLVRGALRRQRGDVTGAERDLGEALVIAHHTGDVSVEAQALIAITRTIPPRGDASRADAGLVRALDLAALAGDVGTEVRALVARGSLLAQRGERDAARSSLERALARARALRSATAEGPIRRRLALIDLHEGRIADARAHLGAAAESAHALHDRRGAAVTRALTALADHLDGALDAASEGYRASIEELAAGGFATLEALAHGGLGLVHAERGDRAEARLLLGGARGAIEGRDPALEVVFGCALAQLEAARGSIEGARAGLTAARMRLADAADPSIASLLDGVERALDPEGRRGGAVAPSACAALLSRLAPRTAPPAGETAGCAADEEPGALRVGEAGSWFRVGPGERVDLARRRPLKKLLDRLAVERVESPGHALAWDDLLEAGWPGEKMRADAGAHRVRVAISTLRKLGLRDALLTRDDGYLIDPGLAVRRGA